MNFSINMGLKLEKSNWFLFGIIIFYLSVAYNSSGFNNADEHFQIIEFANYKFGTTKLDDLAWEFNAQIRSGLQPALCLLFFKLMHLVGLTDAYVLALGLRLIGALLSVFIIRYFVISSKSLIDKKNYNCFILMSYLIWFLPYINVRFSSENWSGLFFLASLALIQFNTYQESTKKLLLLGVLLGISILFRYQSALLAMGVVLWLLIVAKLKIQKITTVIATILAILIVGFFIDRWLYGVYSFTLYNYFYVNIIDKVASNYGTSPWYEILLYIIKAPGPLGIFVFVAFIILIIYKPKSLLIWSTLPLLLVHMIVPHKELRFLFPIANLVPILLVLAYQELSAMVNLSKYRLLYSVALLFLIIANVAGLIVVASKSAGNARVSITEYIHKHYTGKKVNVLYPAGSNPYYDWPFPRNTFYDSREVMLTQIVSIWQPDFIKEKKEGYINLLVISDNEITGPRTIALLNQLHLVRVYQSIPWIDQKIIGLYRASLNDDKLMLYEFRD
ncbi:MAG: hypothetical protein JWR38_477 [Mucilaginibacter sp.]|nr:hypothetical protein [Mucilaginibacter sp.]